MLFNSNAAEPFSSCATTVGCMLCAGLLPVLAAVLDGCIQGSNGDVRTGCLAYVYTMPLQQLASSSAGKSVLQCWTLLSKRMCPADFVSKHVPSSCCEGELYTQTTAAQCCWHHHSIATRTWITRLCCRYFNCAACPAGTSWIHPQKAGMDPSEARCS